MMLFRNRDSSHVTLIKKCDTRKVHVTCMKCNRLSDCIEKQCKGFEQQTPKYGMVVYNTFTHNFSSYESYHSGNYFIIYNDSGNINSLST